MQAGLEVSGANVSNNDTFHSQKSVTILCCQCGIAFTPLETKTNICSKCLVAGLDITEGIPKDGYTIHYCKECERYERPPWMMMSLESKELLALCLKKINGLTKVKLLDANFLYTEPHSKRIKVRIRVSKEVMHNVTIQQTCDILYVIRYMMCPDCMKDYTPHKWVAAVQVRQPVEHKRTFLFLEQLILKNDQHKKIQNIKEEDQGLDFYFKSKGNAMKMVEFLQGVMPIRSKLSKQLISYEEQNNIYNYKFTYSVEIPKICKDDLVIIDNKLARQLGGCGNILICYKVATTIHMLDPVKMIKVEMPASMYFQNEKSIHVFPFKGNATEFMVNKVEMKDASKINTSFSYYGLKYQLADTEIVRTADWQTFFVKTHLGAIINDGDMVLGYDLTTMTIPESVNPKILEKSCQDILLIKKQYPPRVRKNKNKSMRLKRLAIQTEQTKAKKGATNDDDLFEDFLEELENNPDMKNQIQVFTEETINAAPKEVPVETVEPEEEEKEDVETKLDDKDEEEVTYAKPVMTEKSKVQDVKEVDEEVNEFLDALDAPEKNKKKAKGGKPNKKN